jgi:hypothetical protein
MLPSTIDRARIMRFGYDSQWFGDHVIKQKLSTVANELLRVLEVERAVCADQFIGEANSNVSRLALNAQFCSWLIVLEGWSFSRFGNSNLNILLFMLMFFFGFGIGSDNCFEPQTSKFSDERRPNWNRLPRNPSSRYRQYNVRRIGPCCTRRRADAAS